MTHRTTRGIGRRLALAATLLVAALAPARAQTGLREVVVEADVDFDAEVPQALARRRALERAEGEAVTQVAGACVSSLVGSAKIEQNNRATDHFVSSVLLSAAGRVASRRILADSLRKGPRLASGAQSQSWHVKLRVGVEPNPRGCGAGDFDVKVDVDRRVLIARPDLRDSDKWRATIGVTEDAYVMVFSLDEADTVQMLVPNARVTENRIERGKPLVIPSRRQSFRAALRNPDSEREYELLFVVATKRAVPLPEDRVAAARRDLGKDRTPPQPGVINTAKFSYADLQHWLSKIPYEERAIALASLEIVRGR